MTRVSARTQDDWPTASWPEEFPRIPVENWVTEPVEDFGSGYDELSGHAWYKNLEPTVAQALATLKENATLLDYSCGTGILADRILSKVTHPVQIVNVDASAKFLRVALAKFVDDERVAFRLLHMLQQEKRLQFLDEATGPALISRIDLLTSTNAIHLYDNLGGTFASWHRILRPGALALISSANIRNPQARHGDWILDETVSKINKVAVDLVQDEPLFAAYRKTLDDQPVMAAHTQYREAVFRPVRSLDTYLDALTKAGFIIQHVFDQTIHVPVHEFASALGNYHDGVLGWVGGTRKVEGHEPSATAVRDRRFLIKYSMERLFTMDYSFPVTWTYITCRR